MPRPGRLSPGKETWCPLYRGLSGLKGIVWTGVGILTATGIRSLDQPARGELLCNEAILRPISIKIIKKV